MLRRKNFGGERGFSAFWIKLNNREVALIYGRKIHSDGIEKALTAFFKPPVLSFSRKLRNKLDEDPEYLKRHEGDIFPRVQQVLRDAGVPLDEENSSEQMRHMIREVVVRLRSYEKGAE